MKNEFSKKWVVVISAFTAGIIITVFVYQAITVYKVKAQSDTDHAVLTQVVNFINQGIQAQQQAQQQAEQAQQTKPATQPAASSPSGTTSTKK